MIDNKRL